MGDNIQEVVDDQLQLNQLDTMFDNVDANITALNDTITAIKTAENTYGYFADQIDAFKQYEESIQATLTQLKTFVDDPNAVGETTRAMSDLETQVDKSTLDYKTIVDSNNALAQQVRANYDAYKVRLMQLSDRATRLRAVKDQYTSSIAQKRALNYDKSVAIKLASGHAYTAAAQSVRLDTTGLLKSAANQLYDVGRNFFIADDKDEQWTLVLYTGPRKEISLKMDYLTTAASGANYDTTTRFNVRVRGSSGTPTDHDVSMVDTPRFFVDMGDVLLVQAKGPVTVASCQITLGWELKEDPPVLIPSLVYDICGWWGGKTNKVVVDPRGNGYVYLDGTDNRATAISSTQFKIAGPYGDMVGTLIGTDENPTVTFGDGSSWTPALIIAPLPPDPAVASSTERNLTTTLTPGAGAAPITDTQAFSQEFAATMEQNLGLPAGSVVVSSVTIV